VKASTTHGPRQPVPSGEPDSDHRLRRPFWLLSARKAFPRIERDCGIEVYRWNRPKVDARHGLDASEVFLAATPLRAKNISGGGHGHTPLFSIHNFLSGEDITEDDRCPRGDLVAE